MLTHGEKAFIWLAHFGEGIEKGIGYAINDPRRLLRDWRMRDMLMHYDMLP